ncbi:hypothetical protein B296_00048346 [Ensete ventricosum]|uniref:Uncharacterized protein n=1 Tax=Ensete ventricosum TaxID=4639 RepID=A0A426XEP4_ENSVE|nr:hypothetical protein B296_00048346 [Ensete ventricosum]
MRLPPTCVRPSVCLGRRQCRRRCEEELNHHIIGAMDGGAGEDKVGGGGDEDNLGGGRGIIRPLCEETKVGEVEGDRDEEELDNHIIGTVGGGTREYEVGDGGDEDTQEEEERLKYYYMLSVKLINAYPPLK